MTTFTQAVSNQEARTENGMRARASTTNANVDLFFKIGASRGKKITPDFVKAFVENEDYAMRIAQWVRDVRQGAGERQLFIDIVNHLENKDVDKAIVLVKKVPELGRIKDLVQLNLKNLKLRKVVFEMIKEMLENGQKANNLLSRIDNMSEEECQKELNKINNDV